MTGSDKTSTNAGVPTDRANDRVPTVRASGCATWRRSSTEGTVEFLLVHRPRYDDWSFPKGKLDPGETDEECARRELAEETGLSAELGPELTAVEYVDHRGRPKLVRYWAVEITGPQSTATFEPNDEVDRVAWLSPQACLAELSYDHDRTLVTEALDVIT